MPSCVNNVHFPVAKEEQKFAPQPLMPAPLCRSELTVRLAPIRKIDEPVVAAVNDSGDNTTDLPAQPQMPVEPKYNPTSQFAMHAQLDMTAEGGTDLILERGTEPCGPYGWTADSAQEKPEDMDSRREAGGGGIADVKLHGESPPSPTESKRTSLRRYILQKSGSSL